MELLPVHLRAALAHHPIGAHDGLGQQAKVIAKFFFPAGRYTFFVTEGSPSPKDEDDYLFFGYCVSHLGPDCDEWGYCTLSELQSVEVAGIRIERDLYFPCGVWTVAEALARQSGAT
jgi:hypothetical protein